MIPVIDIGCCLVPETEGGDPSAFKEAAKLFHDAISEHGVCYLSNHGVTQKALDDLTSASLSFFRQPEEVKRRCLISENFDGWVPFETEGTNPARPHKDVKEIFNYFPGVPGSRWLSEEVPDMHRSYEEVYRQCQQLGNRIFDIMGLALELEDRSYLTKCHQLISKTGNGTCLRCAYYPHCSELKDQQIACGEHFDYGSITFLFLDDIGGLQIEGKDGEYHDVPLVPGAVLVLMGAAMDRWTADKYPAKKHRVIKPRQAVEQRRDRHSIVFFVNPDDDTVVTCLDGSNKYPPVTFHDFFFQQLNSIY